MSLIRSAVVLEELILSLFANNLSYKMFSPVVKWHDENPFVLSDKAPLSNENW